MAQQDILRSALMEVGLALAPLRTITTADRARAFFSELGYDLQGSAFSGALNTLATQAGETVTAVRALATASGDGPVLTALGNLTLRVVATIDAIDQLRAALQAGPALLNLNRLPERLVDHLLLDYAVRKRPELHAILHLLGLVENDAAPAPNAPRHAIHWDRIGKLFTAPGDLADQVYGWNSTVDTDRLFARMIVLMRSASLPGGLYPQSDSAIAALGNAPGQTELRMPILQKGFTQATYSQFGIALSPADAKPGKKKGVALMPYIMGAAGFDFSVCDRGELVFESSADVTGIGAIVRPPFNAEGLLNLTASYRAALSIREKQDRADEMILVGTAGGTRLSLQGLGVTWSTGNPKGKLDLGVEGEVRALKLVVRGGDGDGFLQQVLSGVNVEAVAQMAAGFSLQNGFTFRGGADLAIDFPVHIELGPVKIDGLRLELGPAADRFELDAGAVIRLDLGPLKAVVENIGITAALSFRKGNLGPLDLAVGFKPPNGVGLSVDAGIVKGGGYLFLDPDRGEYAGALELTFAEFLSLKAIGIITTKMPDGSPGFSLLIIITAEFGATGLQLGYGFTLLGVGGLIGLNRTIQLDALAAGVRTGAVNNILFPTDIVANAPRIISDLRTIFPPQNGRFLIGPMAKLGWGTPTLVSISLGIIIEIPGNIAILGVLKVALPTQDAPLVVIQVAFIGAIEFDKKRIWFFASLYESRVLFITIDGDMGLLAAFGDDANFVLSVGGFHPRFSPPALPFPVPTRISLSILNESWGRVRAEAYLAVTSNTVQFGARAEAYFGFDALSVEGGISFDALIQFEPFRFTVEFSSHWSVKVFGAGVFGVSVQLMLQGPARWRAKGRGSISLLFFDVSVDFDESWGQSDTSVLEPVQALQVLAAEFAKPQNWRAFTTAGKQELVSLRALDPAAEALVLHPNGVLRVLQKAAPLGIPIAKIGNRKITDGKLFRIASATAGLEKAADVREQFASAQFNTLSDQARLAAPAFEQQDGGLDLSPEGAALFSATAIRRNNRYELVTIDTAGRRRLLGLFALTSLLGAHLVKGSAVSLASVSALQAREKNPFATKVAAKTEGFVIATTETNTALAGAATFASEAGAKAFLDERVRTDPSLAGTMQVVASWELAA